MTPRKGAIMARYYRGRNVRITWTPCTCAQADRTEAALNVRVDMDGERKSYQLVHGRWQDVTNLPLLPAVCRTAWPANTSRYFRPEHHHPE